MRQKFTELISKLMQKSGLALRATPFTSPENGTVKTARILRTGEGQIASDCDFAISAMSKAFQGFL